MISRVLSISLIVYAILFSQTILSQEALYFSAIQGDVSKTQSIEVSSLHPDKFTVSITGTQSTNFKHISTEANGNNSIIKVRYEPNKEAYGISRTELKINKGGSIVKTIGLRGMGIPALEGENEASLSSILDLLDIGTNIGWSSLSNHIDGKLQGEEIGTGLFEKASNGHVTITPIARYSPPSIIPFGYYIPGSDGPELKQVGILADSDEFHEHQAIYPSLQSGSTEFDPKGTTFGFYVVSHTHNSFTEDIWNIISYPERTSHSARIYPVRTKKGALIKNSYLVCYEEASNGDYQDYVFLIENVRPVEANSQFKTLLQANNFSGWDIFLDTNGLNNDPESMFSVKDGILQIVGKELGYVITDESYKNYHFKLQFKWGEDKWPPRVNEKRDSGICYHIPEDDKDKIWPLSVECQIQEGDTGDFWLLGHSTIEVDGKQNDPQQYSNVKKSSDNELPLGEWNTVEVLTLNGICVHIVNGRVVNYGTKSSLKKGRILLQSEFAEIFYRNVQIREF